MSSVKFRIIQCKVVMYIGLLPLVFFNRLIVLIVVCSDTMQ